MNDIPVTFYFRGKEVNGQLHGIYPELSELRDDFERMVISAGQ
jgi:hypothetical protein